MTRQNPLERFTILHELGGGAIGSVYAARDSSTGAVVALKTLDPALFGESDAKLAELFLNNARSAARLRHRNIVKVHDAGEAGGTAYVAMELLEGESLRNMLDNRPLSVARAIQIFDDIASALAYAHEEGMVHRGIKPSNIIVLRSGVAKLGDFGIGQIGQASLRYMSPEQVRGDPVDHRSDIFSLGAVFYEMLTRRAPFEGKSPKEITEGILRAQPPRPSEVNRHVPAALDGMVFSMLAADPDKRFANARILLRDLQRLEEELGLGPGASAGASEPTVRVPPDGSGPRLPAAKREPTLRTPDPDRFHVPAPMQDVPRFGALDEHDARFMMDREPEPERSSGSRATRFAAFALTLAVLLAGIVHYSSRPNEPRASASRMQEATAPAPPRSALPPPVAEAPKEPVTAPAAPKPVPPKLVVAESSPPAQAEPAQETPQVAQEPSRVASAPKPLPPKALAPKPSPPAKTESLPVRKLELPAAKISEPQPGGTAKLLLAVSPQGEVYVDGKHHGATPPITTLDLEPGMHRIEIRSGSRKPYVTYMAVQAGDQRRIRHDFDAKPSRPPT